MADVQTVLRALGDEIGRQTVERVLAQVELAEVRAGADKLQEQIDLRDMEAAMPLGAKAD